MTQRTEATDRTHARPVAGGGTERHQANDIVLRSLREQAVSDANAVRQASIAELEARARGQGRAEVAIERSRADLELIQRLEADRSMRASVLETRFAAQEAFVRAGLHAERGRISNAASLGLLALMLLAIGTAAFVSVAASEAHIAVVRASVPTESFDDVAAVRQDTARITARTAQLAARVDQLEREARATSTVQNRVPARPAERQAAVHPIITVPGIEGIEGIEGGSDLVGAQGLEGGGSGRHR